MITPDDILRFIAESGREGFSGKCGGWAVWFNNHYLDGAAVYVVSRNAVLWREFEKFVGHVALVYDGEMYDSSGATNEDILESWGMMDPEDFKYMYYENLMNDASDEDFQDMDDFDFPNLPEEWAYESEVLQVSEQYIKSIFGEDCDL